MITWVSGLLVSEKGWIVYPVRMFAEENRSSFTYEYFIYPAVCALFNVHYPTGRSLPLRLAYFAAYCTALTGIEVLIIINVPGVIRYIHWAWYWTWKTLLITFGMSRLFCKWFFAVWKQPQS